MESHFESLAFRGGPGTLLLIARAPGMLHGRVLTQGKARCIAQPLKPGYRLAIPSEEEAEYTELCDYQYNRKKPEDETAEVCC